MSEEFRKYVKMKSMLPEGAVRQKMTNDGFAAADIEDFLSGKVASLPPPSAQSSSSSFSAAAPPRPPMSQMLQQAPALRSASAAPPRAPPPAEPRRMSLLDEIKKGPQLKAVVKDDARMKQTPVKGAGGGSVGGGLLGMLALEMSKRRFNMNSQNDESSDSDSGFSDSDSDSD